MKGFFFTGLLLLATILLQAQTPAVTVYGFRQHLSPGMQKAGDIDEKGNFTKKEAPATYQYRVYLSIPANKVMRPIQLMINGEAYAVQADTVTNLSNDIIDSAAPTDSTKPLFPKTTGTLLRLTPTPLVYDKGNPHTRALAKSNAVVVLYTAGGKLRYGVLKKFTDLAPGALQ